MICSLFVILAASKERQNYNKISYKLDHPLHVITEILFLPSILTTSGFAKEETVKKLYREARFCWFKISYLIKLFEISG